MKATEIKAKELVYLYFQALPTPCMDTYEDIFKVHKERAIQCAIISQKREVDLLLSLLKLFDKHEHLASSSNYIFGLLKDAEEILLYIAAKKYLERYG